MLASCHLRIFDSLLLHTEHFEKNILSIYNFWIFTFCIFSTLQTLREHCFIFSLNFYFPLEFLISSFISLTFFDTLFIKTNSSWLTFESVKALDIKTSTSFNLDFANYSISLFFFSLIYWIMLFNSCIY